jgi:hypothetical protein
MFFIHWVSFLMDILSKIKVHKKPTAHAQTRSLRPRCQNGRSGKQSLPEVTVHSDVRRHAAKGTQARSKERCV